MYIADLRNAGITSHGHPLAAVSAELTALLGPNPLPQLQEILINSYELPGAPTRRIGVFAYVTEAGVARIKIDCQLRRDGWGLLIATEQAAELQEPDQRCHRTGRRDESTSGDKQPEDQQQATEEKINPSKRKGDRAEVAARDFLRGQGFPGAERTRAGYARDAADLHLCPGVVAQVKDCKALRWSEWFAELAEQQATAGAEHAVLIVKRPGQGEAGRWLAVMPVESMARLLRLAGYGTPPESWEEL